MGHRLASMGSLGILVVASTVVSLVTVSLRAQNADVPPGTTTAAPTWTERTPWGDPDLEGIWSYATLTPLERPVEMGDREVLTDEEVAARDARSQVDRPPRPGGTGAYNRFWFDQGTASKRTSQIIDPPDGRLPAMTPEAQKRLERRKLLRSDGYVPESWLDLQTDDRCIMYHGVPPQPSGYNNTWQVFQAPGLVTILAENIHHVRLIPLDDRPHLGDAIRQWNGDSIGHWDGDTLVVETTNYSEKTELRYPLQMEGFHNARAIERFTRLDADTIDYRFTIEDPTIYTRPWTAMLPLEKLHDYRIYEYACHEGNYSIVNMLSGARKADAEAAKSGGKR